MKVALFIANKINLKGQLSFSRTIIRIATLGVILGIAVMLIATAVLFGFQEKITDKVVNYSAHMVINKYANAESFDLLPFSTNFEFFDNHESVEEIESLQPFLTKTAILRTDDAVAGVLLKGIAHSYDLTGISENVISGSVKNMQDTAFTNQSLISYKIASSMKLKPGDSYILYFAHEPPRLRKMVVSGVFQTGLEEFDNHFILCNMHLIQDLEKIGHNMVGGIEVKLKDFESIDKAYEKIYEAIPYELELAKVTDLYVGLFDWLKLLDRNVVIIITLILIVAGINLVSALLVLILERTNMIGILQALGCNQTHLGGIFFFLGARILIHGMVWGNIIGLSLCALQYFFRIIPLQPENYYMTYVPISFSLKTFIALNVGTFLVTAILLSIPAYFTGKINILKAIRMS